MIRFKQYLLENTQSKKLSYHDAFHQKLKNEFGNEYNIILDAAKRNGINPDNYEELSLLYSIRRAEHGGQGKEFGVLTPKAGLQPGDTPEKSLDRQAGHAAFSVHKRMQEFNKLKSDPKTKFDKDFVTYFGEKWAPIGVENDPKNLNKNWIPNVQKFNSSFMTCEGFDCEARVVTPTGVTPTKTEPPSLTDKIVSTAVEYAPMVIDTFSKTAEPIGGFPQQSENKPKESTSTPSTVTYTVKKGDNLNKIANNNKQKMDAIIKANNILDPNKIQIGQKLIIP
jgi:LysM repeat protein